MSDLSVSGARRRHFTPEDEAAIAAGPTTSTIVQYDAKSKVGIQGADKGRRELAEEHHGHVGVAGAADVGVTTVHAAGVAGLDAVLEASPHVALRAVGAALGSAAGVISFTAIGYGLMLHDLEEQKAQGREEGKALEREALHKGLVGALDLPKGYKDRRIEKDFAHIPMNKAGERAMDVAAALRGDQKGLAVLQARADAGMNAARDMTEARLTDRAAFLAQNPAIAARYAKDAAFHEGFDAYLATTDAAERGELDAKLDAKDARRGAPAVPVRG